MDVDVNTYLPYDLFTKADIATMANSLEARSPLIDHPLMEWAARLPTSLKIRGKTTKYLLRRAVADWLPPQLLTLPKKGFGIPLAEWLRGPLRDMAHDLLTDTTARQRGLFRPDAVAALLREHERGYDQSAQLWTLIQLERWHRRYLDGPVIPPRRADPRRDQHAPVTVGGHPGGQGS